jgi:2-amino-4-hydroxy-6-hydroxymethyldihydropteridine diphosphokinase
MENVAYIALGSNLGDRLNYLRSAIIALHEHKEISVIDASSIYETEPVGYTDQDCFLNMVIKIKTALSPFSLLQTTRKIEEQFGRKRDIRWGPRTLDLDILLYNHENIETEQLIIPHPRMMERAFVLIPLFEIDATIRVPNVDKPLPVIIDQLSDKEGVRIWKPRDGGNVFALFEN